MPTGPRLVLPSILTRERPVKAPETVLDQLLKLDSWGGGLPEAEFQELFLKCACGIVVTNRQFEEHTCIRQG